MGPRIIVNSDDFGFCSGVNQGSKAGTYYRSALKCGYYVGNAIEIELAVQVEWVIDKGISPTHLDSHKHIHTFPSIYPIVVRLAERFNIAAIRWPFEPKRISGSDWPSPTKGGIIRARIVRTMAKINHRQNDKFIRNDGLQAGNNSTGKIR